jgi:LacI family transcriptional regulator, gluconate utilization system Gnt-I transcriptional repressor
MSSASGKSRANRLRGTTRMADVARAAGVSTMTVSRFLSQPDRVSSEMRVRIEQALNQSGYMPNRLARNLSSNRSNVIGMIVPSLSNSLFAETVKGISDRLHDSDFLLMLADSGHSLEKEEALVKAFLTQRVGGLALHNTTHTIAVRDMIARAGIPVVEMGNLAHEPLDSVVSYSNFEAARLMTNHLARLGYRQIAFVSLPVQGNDRSAERRRGYLAALDELGRAVDRRLILERPAGLGSGAEAVTQLIEAVAEVDAIFFAGDVLALGAVSECQKRGWAVPGRVGIATFDDVDMLRFATPTVTTIRLPRYEIGRRSAQYLLERVNGVTNAPISLNLGFEIIQRDST